MIPVIIAGGSGTRLWPLSRLQYPKQFLSLTSEQSMLLETINRLDQCDHESPIIICNNEHRFIVAEQLRQQNQPHNGIILEPVGRNTAPAIALAAMHALSFGEDPLLLVLPADHVIKNEAALTDSIQKALPLANQDMLVTFGIIPNRPETGYGYIRKDKSVSDFGYKVKEFVEKPDLETATEYVCSQDYYWNSGMFLFKASRYLQELTKFNPEMVKACKDSLYGSKSDLEFIRLDEDAFINCPDDSIDYAVMEKTTDAVVVPLDADWNDVGSWSALWDVNDKDESGNVIKGDVLTEQTRNSYIYSQNKLVATVGVDDLIIVETKDAVLVSHKDKVQEVKSIVSKLKDCGRSEYLQHREVYRPWGMHDHIAEGDRYHVKKVIVKPGEKTATQIHHHRAEHWIVVSGTAKVRNGDKTLLVTENESTFIPVGAPHSFENPGVIPLELIEVRTGTYLKENDIVRIDEDGEGY